METRIRGGTPTTYEVGYRIDDPELMAQLDETCRRGQQRMAEYVNDSIDRIFSEYHYHPPPEMLDSDTDDEPLPYYGPPSPASTPPPPRQNPAPLQIATVPPIPPRSTYGCSCEKRAIIPYSGPGSPPIGSFMDRILIHKPDCYQMLYRSAITKIPPDQAVLQEDQISSHPTNHPPSVEPPFKPPPFSPAAADPLPHKPKSAVRRARQSQPSSIITRSKSSASTILGELPHSLPQGRQSSRSRAVKRPTAFTKSGGPRLRLQATTNSSTKPRTHAGVNKANVKRGGKGKKK
ncbi:MAG: hypothetical protein Q9171_003469 [Xanthocarpia ochracea]